MSDETIRVYVVAENYDMEAKPVAVFSTLEAAEKFVADSGDYSPGLPKYFVHWENGVPYHQWIEPTSQSEGGR